MFKNPLMRFVLIVCFLASTAFTCSLTGLVQQLYGAPAMTTEAPTDDLTTAIQSVINREIEAAQTEQLADYMATIHPQSPSYAATESTLKTIFAQYDLDYSVTLGEATLLDNGDATIPFVLTTRKISGAAFRDNEVTGNFILRLDGTQWKVYNQEIQNIRYL
jgi:murein L,D-transpeptidase YcbB/YkuD